MNDEEIVFGVFADLHMDIMPDPETRVNAFIEGVKTADADFVIQLGDFSHWVIPEKDLSPAVKNYGYEMLKHQLIERFNSTGKPSYFVLGNHDMDRCSKQQVAETHKMSGRYYSFVCKGWRCFVLDGNFYRDKEGRFVDYSRGNYFSSGDLPYIDPAQMQWLEDELESSDMPAIVFSHQELNESDSGIKNADELRRLFRKVNQKRKRIYLCVNGHMHIDALTQQDDIFFYNVNSISNYYCGEEYQFRRFGDDIETAFPSLKHTFPYKKPLFAIIAVSKHGMRINGVEGEFILPAPKELGSDDLSITPSITDRSIKWDCPADDKSF